MDILNKLKHIQPLNANVLLYNSLILSHVNICILTWGYQCDRVLKLQKRIISPNAHPEKILKTLKLLKVNDLLKLHKLKLYYKYKNKTLPHYVQNNTSTHIYAIRI